TVLGIWVGDAPWNCVELLPLVALDFGRLRFSAAGQGVAVGGGVVPGQILRVRFARVGPPHPSSLHRRRVILFFIVRRASSGTGNARPPRANSLRRESDQDRRPEQR